MSDTLDFFEQAESDRQQRLRQEKSIRDEILHMHQRRRKAWLAELRDVMADLYIERFSKRGDLAYVTVADAREVFETWDVPSSALVDRRFLGAIFKSSEWELIPNKIVPSSTGGCHARPIACARLKSNGQLP